jgi:hypothetical protein
LLISGIAVKGVIVHFKKKKNEESNLRGSTVSWQFAGFRCCRTSTHFCKMERSCLCSATAACQGDNCVATPSATQAQGSSGKAGAGSSAAAKAGSSGKASTPGTSVCCRQTPKGRSDLPLISVPDPNPDPAAISFYPFMYPLNKYKQ